MSLPIENYNLESVGRVKISTKSALLENAFLLLLVCLAFIIHPYILTIIAGVSQVWIRIKASLFLPFYSVALASFWAFRNYGVSYLGFRDDTTWYMLQFNLMKYRELHDLVENFIRAPGGNEIIYTLFVYLTSLFFDNQIVFAFIIYLLIACLTSISAVRIDNRYYMVFISIIFFGIGSFGELEALHLWRSVIGSLVFLIGLTYDSKNPFVALLIMSVACLIHLSNTIFVLIYCLFFFNKYFNNKYILPAIVLLTFLLFFAFIRHYGGYLDGLTGKSIYQRYFSMGDEVGITAWIKTLVLGVLFFLIKINDINDKNSFLITGLALVTLSYVFFQGVGFSGRIYQAYVLLTALMFFEVLMFIRNRLSMTAILIVLFALKFNALVNSPFMQQAYANFSNLFSGIIYNLWKV